MATVTIEWMDNHGLVVREANDEIGETLVIEMADGELMEPDIHQTGLKLGDWTYVNDLGEVMKAELA